MAGKIVGQAIVGGNAEAGVTIAEIIGLINRYGLSLGCKPGIVSKLYQNNATVNLDGGALDVDEYGGDYVEIEAWDNPSYLTISLDVVVYVFRTPGSSGHDAGVCGCYIVISDTYSGSGPLGAYESTLAYATGTTGQSNILATDPIATHSFVSCQCVYEVPAGVSMKVWGIAQAYTEYYASLDPISAKVDLNILRVSR